MRSPQLGAHHATRGATGAATRDHDVRSALQALLRERCHDDQEVVIVEELGLCQGVARIDLAVIDGSLHGYEIKSASDNLDRLPAQRDVYNRVLEHVTAVSDRTHIHVLRAMIPRWWGLMEVYLIRGRITMKQVRVARRNPRVDPSSVVQLLWRAEALAILEAKNLLAGIRSKPREVLWERLVTNLPERELCAVVSERLRRRTGWRPAQQRV